jgi:hypothetical protein
MPFHLESHLLLVLNHLLSQERTHFFEQFAIQSEQELQQLIPDPNVQHIWKSAHILCRAFDAGFITIKGH